VPAGVVARSAANGGEHIVVPLPVVRRIDVRVAKAVVLRDGEAARNSFFKSRPEAADVQPEPARDQLFTRRRVTRHPVYYRFTPV
jgi:hypothetical protein